MKKAEVKTRTKIKLRIKPEKIDGIPLAVVGVHGQVVMLSRTKSKTTQSLFLSFSSDGIHFEKDEKKITIERVSGKTKITKEIIKNCDRFSLSRTPNGFVLTYVRLSKSRTKTKAKSSGDILVVARSKDLYDWKVMSEMPAEGFHRATVVHSNATDMFEMYTDGLFVRGQSSTSLAVWKKKSSLLFTARRDYFDSETISLIGSLVCPQGILVIYDASVPYGANTLLQAGAVIFDIQNPKRIIWRSEVPIWQGVVEIKKSGPNIRPIGFVYAQDMFMLYWVTPDGEIIVAVVPALFKELEDARTQPKIMKRFHGNPIITPRDGHHWEGEGTFNPTVVQDDDGTVHLLYRALGKDGISRVGYARSKDGVYFDARSPHPVFEARTGFGMPDQKTFTGPRVYNPSIYTSGGGWAGAEDARAVKIGDTIYMMYVAFEGWSSMRIALTSINVADFRAGRWDWKLPKLISSPEQRAKNWLLFPEKIHGKFAIIHGIVPKVMVEYIDDLDSFDGVIESPRPEGPQSVKAGRWDGLIRGAGPPPVKTNIGWLLLYHAHDKRDSGRYKLGAMILDKNDPTKVLYRASHPILSPDMHYENDGKPGVIYASGATVKGDDLYVYYGGADKVSCVATTHLKDFLNYLVSGKADSYELTKVDL